MLQIPEHRRDDAVAVERRGAAVRCDLRAAHRAHRSVIPGKTTGRRVRPGEKGSNLGAKFQTLGRKGQTPGRVRPGAEGQTWGRGSDLERERERGGGLNPGEGG